MHELSITQNVLNIVIEHAKRAKAQQVTAIDLVVGELDGIVQGVGFRPFVYNLAVAYGLRGWVRNTSAGVQVQVEGQLKALDAFVQGLTTRAPRLARIETICVADRSPNGYKGFAIEESLPQEGAYQLVSADIATCPDCLHELFDPDDRRYAGNCCTRCAR
jgi:hydrogenase maturation protein HypF